MNPILKGFDRSLFSYLGHFSKSQNLMRGHNSDGIPSWDEMVDRGQNPEKYVGNLNSDMSYGDNHSIEPDNFGTLKSRMEEKSKARDAFDNAVKQFKLNGILDK